MAAIKYKGTDGQWHQINSSLNRSIDVVQTTGTSVVDVMSQNAVTSELSTKLPKSDFNSYSGAVDTVLSTLREIVTGYTQISAITTDVSSSCSITGASNNGLLETIIYTNDSGANLIVTVPTTYKTSDGDPIELTCPDGGYCEVNYMNISGTIYARGI